MFGDAIRTINDHISDADQQRLNNVFSDGIRSNDLQSIYYSSLNANDLTTDEKSTICNRLITLHTESKLNVS